MMSLVLWNELCPEFYQRINVGTVLYLQNYTLKQSYSNRSRPQMDHYRMKVFNSVGVYVTMDNIVVVVEKRFRKTMSSSSCDLVCFTH